MRNNQQQNFLVSKNQHFFSCRAVSSSKLCCTFQTITPSVLHFLLVAFLAVSHSHSAARQTGEVHVAVLKNGSPNTTPTHSNKVRQHFLQLIQFHLQEITPKHAGKTINHWWPFCCAALWDHFGAYLSNLYFRLEARDGNTGHINSRSTKCCCNVRETTQHVTFGTALIHLDWGWSRI